MRSGSDGGRRVKGLVPESSRRILELLIKPKANCPEVFDSIVKLDCHDGKGEVVGFGVVGFGDITLRFLFLFCCD